MRADGYRCCTRGVSVLRVESMIGVEGLTVRAITYAQEKGWITHGDLVVLVHGMHDAVSGSTNVVRVVEASLHGFASPTSMHFNTPPLPPPLGL
jgi:hypothetical protein